MSKIWQGKSDEGRRGNEGGRVKDVKNNKVSWLVIGEKGDVLWSMHKT